MKYDHGTAMLGEKPLKNALGLHCPPILSPFSRTRVRNRPTSHRLSLFSFLPSIFYTIQQLTHPILDRPTCWVPAMLFPCIAFRRRHDITFSLSTSIPTDPCSNRRNSAFSHLLVLFLSLVFLANLHSATVYVRSVRQAISEILRLFASLWTNRARPCLEPRESV